MSVGRAFHAALSLIVACTGILLFTGKPASATVSNPNIAYHKTVTASSSLENYGFHLTDLVDGQENSSVTAMGWSSNNTTGSNHTEYVQIDLGAAYNVAEIALYPRNDYGGVGRGFPKNFRVMVSADGMNWKTYYKRDASPSYGGAPLRIPAYYPYGSMQARYVKIEGTSLDNIGGEYRMQFAEVEVYETFREIDENLAYGKTVTASSTVEGWGWSAQGLTDGKGAAPGALGWISSNSLGTNHTEWVEVDLGASYFVREFVLHNGPAGVGIDGEGFPVDFTIELSTDGTTWVPVVTRENFPNPENIPQVFQIDGMNARYVKVTGTKLPQIAGEYRMRLSELKVFSYADAVPSLGTVDYTMEEVTGSSAPVIDDSNPDAAGIGAGFETGNVIKLANGEYHLVTTELYNQYDMPTVDLDKYTVTPTGGSAASYEAESGALGGGAAQKTVAGASGGAAVGDFIDLYSYSEITGVGGGSGGSATITVRYANGDPDNPDEPKRLSLYVNGARQTSLVYFPSTGLWNTFGTATATVTLNAGAANTIRVQREDMWFPTRAGHWKSSNGTTWTRVGTVSASNGGDTWNVNSNAWDPNFYYNSAEGKWNVTYVGEEVFRAVSTVSGTGGIDGPYTVSPNVLSLGAFDNSEYWTLKEGVGVFTHGTNSFSNVFSVGSKLYAFIGSGRVVWDNGLVSANQIEGPWTEDNTTTTHDTIYSENPVVTRLDDGTYFAVFDKINQGLKNFGYAFSLDGIHWKQKTIDITVPWADSENALKCVRTPLSLIKEADGNYTVFFTAKDKDENYWKVGKVTVKINKYTQAPRSAATASSQHSVDWVPANAIDANKTTGWSSTQQTQTGSQWLRLDMGTNYNVKRVRIFPRHQGGISYGFPVDFKIQYSTNGTSWTDVPGQSYTNYVRPIDTDQVFTFGSAVTARYVRVLGTKFSTDGIGNYYMQANEINADY